MPLKVNLSFFLSLLDLCVCVCVCLILCYSSESIWEAYPIEVLKIKIVRV
uniref:Uncharacterized protein n=1 Tax=Anguilla anguilla TaxID=7936 RepID=A0A0E9PJQ7_ANGAN